ncbi:TetR/AcrR family transcriptional regulator [uncultured Williamsia sp.]|uniref:TetR/AcrR family transcriptional regulator n=1 Tax=uncultured Williamsia sp. TaxID=259311 RepID=UPI002616065F|nr:TetR/AcrR family transcriptional regulator [uncultured Williamsia sp.]
MTANKSTTRGGARAYTLEKVWELIADGGVGAFSMRDVATTAGVSLGTVTHHFGSRERLVDEAFAALAERYSTIGHVAITSSRSGSHNEACNTLIYALHHLWGERAITLAAAELRTHAARSAAARECAESVTEICRLVVAELHRITDRTGTPPSQVVDLLDTAAVRLAVRHQSPDNFRVAIRRHVNNVYVYA